MLSNKKTIVIAIVLALLVIPVAVVYAAITLQTDDFSGATIDPVWVVDPLTDYTHNPAFFSLVTDGAEKYLEIDVPAGAPYTLSSSSQNAPRLVQAVSDPTGDSPFVVRVKFLNTSSGSSSADYAGMQGIIVRGDYTPTSTTYPAFMRFSLDTDSQGVKLDTFAAFYWKGGSGWTDAINMYVNQELTGVGPDDPVWLQVERVVTPHPTIPGDFTSKWLFSYSTDGTNFTTLATRYLGDVPQDETRTNFEVTHVGVFAGSTANQPGFTAKVDWFANFKGTPANEDPVGPEMYDLTRSVTPGGSGTITGSAAGSYSAGTTINMTAVPTPGGVWAFYKWVVNGVDHFENPLNFQIQEDTTVVAHFFNTTTLDPVLYLPSLGR